MKKLINEQFKRMQLLAGLITESQLGEEILNEDGMTLPIPNFLKNGDTEFKVNFVKFTNNSAGNNGFGGKRNDGSFPVSVETDIQGKGPGNKFVINAYVTKDGNVDQVFLPGYDNSEVLVKYVKDWGPLRKYIASELAKTPATPTNESIDIEKSVNEALRKYRKLITKSQLNEAVKSIDSNTIQRTGDTPITKEDLVIGTTRVAPSMSYGSKEELALNAGTVTKVDGDKATYDVKGKIHSMDLADLLIVITT